MPEERKHVQKSPLSHILSLPSTNKKRTFSEKRMSKPDIGPVPTAPQSAPATSDTVPETFSAIDSQGENHTNEPEKLSEDPAPDAIDLAKPEPDAEKSTNNNSATESLAVKNGGTKANEDDTGAGPREAQPASEDKESTPPPDTNVESESKKIKIDSSDVINSVAHFGNFVSGVEVYTPGRTLFDGVEDHLNSTVWVRVARRYLTRKNPGVERRKLWGTDVYTDDSDLIAALYHSGNLDPRSDNQSVRTVTNGDADILVGVTILPRLLKYTGSYMHELNSRSWGSYHDGVSFRIHRVSELSRGSAEFPVSEAVDRAKTWGTAYLQQKNVRASLRF